MSVVGVGPNHGTPTVHRKEPLMSFNKSKALSRLRASFCRHIDMNVQMAI